MKVTIKKLLKMGLNKNQIKEILEIDDEKYSNLDKWGRSVEISNLPKKIDYVLKGGNVSDYKKADLFDEIYEINKVDSTSIPFEEKIRVIKEFPSFVKYIEIKIARDQINELNNKKEEYLMKTKNIDKKINSLNLQISLINNEEKVKEPVKEKQTKEVPTLIENVDVRIYNSYSRGSKRVHIYNWNERGLEAGDYIKIANSEGIEKYQISESKKISTMQYIKLIEKIVTNKGE